MRRGGLDERVLESERGSEDHGVAVSDEVFDGLGHFGSFGDVLLVGGFDSVTEVLLHCETSFVVRLRPTTIVGGSDVHPRGLQRAFFGGAIDDHGAVARGFGARSLGCRGFRAGGFAAR